MATTSAVISFYRNSQVIERFRSRISFRDELNSLNNFKRHFGSFLAVKEKARELGVTWNLVRAQIVSFGEVSQGSK